MRIGIYGGSFDPIHYGHIRPVLAAQGQLGLDKVVFLPTGRPPHKPDRSMAPVHARFAMVELALLEYSDLVVSPLEMTDERPSYTVETVEHYSRTHAEAELFLLIGGDSLVALESWRRWRDLVAACRIGVLVRPGWEEDRVRAEASPEIGRLAASDRTVFIDNPPERISSTRLRSLLAAGKSLPEGSMPPAVLQYVRKYSLYS